MPSPAKCGHCALARADRVFGTDEKHIRTENTVMDKSKGGLGWFLYKIADCARMAFHPCAIGDLRGRDAVRVSARDLSSAQQRNSITTSAAI